MWDFTVIGLIIKPYVKTFFPKWLHASKCKQSWIFSSIRQVWQVNKVYQVLCMSTSTAWSNTVSKTPQNFHKKCYTFKINYILVGLPLYVKNTTSANFLDLMYSILAELLQSVPTYGQKLFKSLQKYKANASVLQR
jgi:hypothetical protein